MTDVLDGTAVVAISFNEGELWVIFRDWHFINHYCSCSQKIFYHMSKIYLCFKSHNPEGLLGLWKVGKETRKKLCLSRGRFGNVTSILNSSLSLTCSLAKTFIRINTFRLQGQTGIGLTPKPQTGSPSSGRGGLFYLSLLKQRVSKGRQRCSFSCAVWLERTDKPCRGWAWRPSWPKIPSLEFGKHHILPTYLTVIPKI